MVEHNRSKIIKNLDAQRTNIGVIGSTLVLSDTGAEILNNGFEEISGIRSKYKDNDSFTVSGLIHTDEGNIDRYILTDSNQGLTFNVPVHEGMFKSFRSNNNGHR